MCSKCKETFNRYAEFHPAHSYERPTKFHRIHQQSQKLAPMKENSQNHIESKFQLLNKRCMGWCATPHGTGASTFGYHQSVRSKSIRNKRIYMQSGHIHAKLQSHEPEECSFVLIAQTSDCTVQILFVEEEQNMIKEPDEEKFHPCYCHGAQTVQILSNVPCTSTKRRKVRKNINGTPIKKKSQGEPLKTLERAREVNSKRNCQRPGVCPHLQLNWRSGKKSALNKFSILRQSNNGQVDVLDAPVDVKSAKVKMKILMISHRRIKPGEEAHPKEMKYACIEENGTQTIFVTKNHSSNKDTACDSTSNVIEGTKYLIVEYSQCEKATRPVTVLAIPSRNIDSQRKRDDKQRKSPELNKALFMISEEPNLPLEKLSMYPK
jgi:hypothetical protein